MVAIPELATWEGRAAFLGYAGFDRLIPDLNLEGPARTFCSLMVQKLILESLRESCVDTYTVFFEAVSESLGRDRAADQQSLLDRWPGIRAGLARRAESREDLLKIPNIAYIEGLADGRDAPLREGSGHSLSRYLISISEFPDYRRWDERYAELRVQISRIRVLSFRNQKSDEDGQVEELVAAIRGRRRCILLGSPGSGKTTSLEYLMYLQSQIAQQARDRGEAIDVPVYIPLNHYNAESALNQLIHEALERQGAVFRSREDVAAFVREIPLFILFDGLNEIPRGDRPGAIAGLKRLLKNFPKNRYVITCRTEDYSGELGDSESPIDVLVIQPLAEEIAKSYLLEQLGETVGEALWHALPAAMRDMARRPMMLRMLREVGQAGGSVRNRADLFTNYVDSIFLWEASKGDRTWITPPQVKTGVLDRVAFEMHTKHILQIEERELQGLISGALAECQEPFNWRNILTELRLNGLLRYDTVKYAFPHQLFQEYFAAVSLHRRLPELSDEVWDRLVEDQWWGEALITLAGLVEDVDQLVLRISTKNPVLAARCNAEGGKTKSETKVAIADRLVPEMKHTYSGRYARHDYDAMRWMASLGKHAVGALKAGLTHRDLFIRSRCVDLLMRIDLGEVRRYLLAMLADSNVFVRYTVAELIATQNLDVKDELLDRLRDSDPDVRSAAATALSLLGPLPIELIVPMVKDPDSRVRTIGVGMLEGLIAHQIHRSDGLGCREFMPFHQRTARFDKPIEGASDAPPPDILERVLDLCRVALSDRHWRIRMRTVGLLGRIGGARARSSLIEALRVEVEPQTLMQIVELLAPGADVGLASPLLEASARLSLKVHLDVVAGLLARFGSASAPLCRKALVTGAQPSVAYCALMTIAELGDRDSVALVIPWLADKNPQISGLTAWTLGKLGSPEALPYLERAKTDAPPGLKWSVPPVPISQTIDEAINRIRSRGPAPEEAVPDPSHVPETATPIEEVES